MGNPILFKRGLIFPIRGFRDYKFGLGVGSPSPSKGIDMLISIMVLMRYLFKSYAMQVFKKF